MTKIQQWVGVAAVAVVVILAAGWFLVVGPQRTHAHALLAQSAAQRGQTTSLRTQLSILQAQSKALPAKQAELAKFGRQIPSNPALPALIRSLTAAGSAAGVDLVSIAPGAAAAPSTAAAPVAGPAGAASAGRQGVTTLGTTSSASSVQATALVLKVKGTYAQLEQFLANLEGLERVLLVSGYSIGTSTGGSDSTASATAGTATKGCPSACQLELDLTGQVFTVPVLTTSHVAPAPVQSTVK